MPARKSPEKIITGRQVLKTSALQKAIFNSANFSSIATDAKGVIQIFNVGAERMLGYQADEVVNRITPADISDPGEILARASALSVELEREIAPGFEALVFKASRGIEDIYELTYVRKDGSRFPAIVSVTALRDVREAIIGYLLIGTDNTARKHVEAEREKLAASLSELMQTKNTELEIARQAADKANKAKSEFLSSMSHELRSPLNAILGFAQLLDSAHPPATTEQKGSISQILQAGWYLLTLINEILDLSVIESGKLSLSVEPVSLAEVFAECADIMGQQGAKRGLTITFPKLSKPHFVAADRTRLKQVLINLLSNAIKYNQPGGKIIVTREIISAERTRIAVRDTGKGLTKEKLAALFQPFNRLGQEAGPEEGTGIGLVMSKLLVELMGGAIGVESVVGTGSVFWFELDTADSAIAITKKEVETAVLETAVNAQVRTVLYVEDNHANLELVKQLLGRRKDLRLLTAIDALVGISLARDHQPDLVLMDINLPGLSGFEALKVLKKDKTTAHIPVVAVSANAMMGDIKRGLEAGFLHYVTKPIKVDLFMEALDDGLRFAAARSSERNQ